MIQELTTSNQGHGIIWGNDAPEVSSSYFVEKPVRNVLSRPETRKDQKVVT